MNREILFRGKDCFGNWQEGSLITDNKTYWFIDNHICKVKVDEKTIGQFLFDANGHRFFQDCIIKRDKSDQLWIIVWNAEINNFSCLTAYEYKQLSDPDSKPFVLQAHSPVSYVWILKNNFYPVGSIHDNPELL
jgi:hypothetical protein